MAAEEQSTLIDVTNINEKVYNFIKTNIISYNYPPGYNLNLNQLSELLGVSRNHARPGNSQCPAEPGFAERCGRQPTRHGLPRRGESLRMDTVVFPAQQTNHLALHC